MAIVGCLVGPVALLTALPYGLYRLTVRPSEPVRVRLHDELPEEVVVTLVAEAAGSPADETSLALDALAGGLGFRIGELRPDDPLSVHKSDGNWLSGKFEGAIRHAWRQSFGRGEPTVADYARHCWPLLREYTSEDPAFYPCLLIDTVLREDAIAAAMTLGWRRHEEPWAHWPRWTEERGIPLRLAQLSLAVLTDCMRIDPSLVRPWDFGEFEESHLAADVTAEALDEGVRITEPVPEMPYPLWPPHALGYWHGGFEPPQPVGWTVHGAA